MAQAHTWRIQYWCNSTNTERTMHLNCPSYEEALAKFDETHPSDRRLHIYKEYDHANDDW